ncbi:MAG: hypothetical protein J0L55_01445 [Caulobacterales bacterium]|nr:hypothetical protein [Caulobacterales bacterium]MCA0371569.1 hypothetical protein [Pseudomonadota bacterium]
MNAKISTLLRRLAIVALLFVAIVRVALPSWNKIQIWQLNDNDDAMRILQVRDWLNGQGFYDLINHRLNPPNGGDIHWSRLSDLPLAISELILRPFLGIDMAEKAAAFGVPLILAAIFAFCVGRAANIVVKSYAAIFIGVFMAVMTPGVMGYFSAGRVDHHGLQLIFLACAFWGLMARDKKGAILAGLSIPASLTIGLELLPILGLMVAWVAIIWAIRGDETREQTKVFSLWFALGTILGFVINVAPNDYLNGANDRLSIAQVLPILTGCVGLYFAAHFMSGRKIWYRFFSLMALGGVVLGIIVQFPVLFKPPYWQTNALMQRMWLSIVSETFPLTRLIKNEISVAINLGMFVILTTLAGLIKLGLLIKDYKKHENREIDNWALMAPLLLITTLMLFFLQARFAGQAAAIAVVVASVLLADLYEKHGLLNALIIGLALNPIIPTSVAAGYNKFFPKKKGQYETGGGANCVNTPAFAELAKLPPGKIVGNIDLGARALLTTHHTVLAAPYHRNQGNFTAYDILMTKTDAALAKLHSNNVQYVAYCRKSAEIGNMERETPNGLIADLRKGIVPDYLKPIPTPPKSDVIAYSVVK